MDDADEGVQEQSRPVDQGSARELDAQYRGFPRFEQWSSLTVNEGLWDEHARLLSNRGDIDDALLRRARDVAKRAAAIDTGAIEGLYEVDRGFTFTVAAQTATWEALLDSRGRDVRALIEDQIGAYDLVLDLATQRQPVSEAITRRIHEEICRSQETYLVITEAGPQRQPLPRGEYKHNPNHVWKADGGYFVYCPVDLVPQEMHKFCEELRSTPFEDAHPVLQASYAHYALILIHPFADGNGRVARALASIYFYRHDHVPFLVLSDNRREYFASLDRADKGDWQAFTDFVVARGADAFHLVSASIETARAPQIEEETSKIERLYVTRGGYTHEQIDAAGYFLLDTAKTEVERQIKEFQGVHVQGGVSSESAKVEPANRGYRRPLSQGDRAVGFTLTTTRPAEASVRGMIIVEVPRDSDTGDPVVLRVHEGKEAFAAAVEDLIPTPRTAVYLRLALWVRRILGLSLRELWEQASGTKTRRGY